jgi:hypothetical protein
MYQEVTNRKNVVIVVLISVRRGVGIPTALEPPKGHGDVLSLGFYIHEHLTTQVIPKKAFQARRQWLKPVDWVLPRRVGGTPD